MLRFTFGSGSYVAGYSEGYDDAVNDTAQAAGAAIVATAIVAASVAAIATYALCKSCSSNEHMLGEGDLAE